MDKWTQIPIQEDWKKIAVLESNPGSDVKIHFIKNNVYSKIFLDV